MQTPHRSWSLVVAAIAAVAVLAGCGEREEPAVGGSDGHFRTSAAARFDERRAFDDLRAQVRLGERPTGSPANRRLVTLLAGRLREAGVRDVEVQGPNRNVVGTIPGDEPGAIVVGAHHDTKD